jgi:adenylate cyclase
MASVFLSYDRDDHVKAGEIAAALEKQSHQVWWDQQIRGGAQYSKEIEQALADADAVVVLWSTSSVESAWVRDEAAEGRDRGKLIPVALDAAKPPMGFRQFQTIDLSKGRRRSARGLEQLLQAMGNSGATPHPAPPVQAPPTRKSRRFVIIAGLAIAAALALAAIVSFNPFGSGGADDISAAVSPLDSSPESKALSNDLIAKLGAVSSQQGATLRLIDADSGSGADFLFQVGGSTEQGQPRASLLLLDGRRSAVLWSGQFERPAGGAADLRQEIGYTASQVLDCALDAYHSRQLASKLDALKSYLSGCAAVASTDSADPEAETARFRQVVRAAPNFAAGWAQLILAESEPSTPVQRRQLVADIAQARKLQPDLPEAYFAEMTLLPPEAYASALRLMDHALQENPASALLLGARSSLLFSVGRTSNAVADAKRAADLDPASPTVRNTYIYTLANSGRTEAAFDELRFAERFWPGSSDIAMTKYILNSRYGDPAEALAYVNSSAYDGDVQGARIYLEARMHPTPANVDRAIQLATKDFFAEPRSAAKAQSAAGVLQVLGIFGRRKELLDLALSLPPSDLYPIQEILFRPTVRILWLDPRSLVVAKRIGLLQYWANSGKWPDFCSQPGFPYDCKKEAAKLR